MKLKREQVKSIKKLKDMANRTLYVVVPRKDMELFCKLHRQHHRRNLYRDIKRKRNKRK